MSQGEAVSSKKKAGKRTAALYWLMLCVGVAALFFVAVRPILSPYSYREADGQRDNYYNFFDMVKFGVSEKIPKANTEEAIADQFAAAGLTLPDDLSLDSSDAECILVHDKGGFHSYVVFQNIKGSSKLHQFFRGQASTVLQETMDGETWRLSLRSRNGRYVIHVSATHQRTIQ